MKRKRLVPLQFLNVEAISLFYAKPGRYQAALEDFSRSPFYDFRKELYLSSTWILSWIILILKF